MRVQPFLVLLAALASVPACKGCSESDPLAEATAAMEEIQAAAGRSDIAALKQRVSESYQDVEGRNRQALNELLTFHYLRNRTRHVYSVLVETTLVEPDEVRARVLAALAGQRVNTPADLANIRADLFRFEFHLRNEDGDWQVVRTAWERATPADFLFE